jgi:hypothetical protein
VVESPSISIVKVQTSGNNPVTGVNDVLGYTITVYLMVVQGYWQVLLGIRMVIVF